MFTKENYEAMLTGDGRICLPNRLFTADELRQIADEMDNENLRDSD